MAEEVLKRAEASCCATAEYGTGVGSGRWCADWGAVVVMLPAAGVE